MLKQFILAAFASVCSVTLCWFGHISGSEYVTLQGLVLGLYGAANVVDKKLGGAG